MSLPRLPSSRLGLLVLLVGAAAPAGAAVTRAVKLDNFGYRPGDPKVAIFTSNPGDGEDGSPARGPHLAARPGSSTGSHAVGSSSESSPASNTPPGPAERRRGRARHGQEETGNQWGHGVSERGCRPAEVVREVTGTTGQGSAFYGQRTSSAHLVLDVSGYFR